MTRPDRELRIADGEVLLVDKPSGWTSFDVVNKVRHLFGIRRVGHAGTLDPMATGLLIVCTGPKTKEVQAFMGLEKEYEAAMLLGVRTPSFDADTPVSEQRSIDGIGQEAVLEVLGRFVGRITQIPPMWSAVKVQGRRLYTYARNGVEVPREPREVEIVSIVPTRIDIPVVEMRVTCSKGTYIRALVDDIGNVLGCGAHVTALRRTRIGPHTVSDALTMQELADIAQEQRGKA